MMDREKLAEAVAQHREGEAGPHQYDEMAIAARRLLEAEETQRELRVQLRLKLRDHGHEEGLPDALRDAGLLLVPRLLADPEETR